MQSKLAEVADCYGTGNYVCGRCNKGFSSLRTLTEHKLKVHSVKTTVYECNQCDCQVFSIRRSYMRRHMRAHGRNSTSDLYIDNCITTVPAFDELLKCSSCFYTHTDRQRMALHEASGFHLSMSKTSNALVGAAAPVCTLQSTMSSCEAPVCPSFLSGGKRPARTSSSNAKFSGKSLKVDSQPWEPQPFWLTPANADPAISTLVYLSPTDPQQWNNILASSCVGKPTGSVGKPSVLQSKQQSCSLNQPSTSESSPQCGNLIELTEPSIPVNNTEQELIDLSFSTVTSQSVGLLTTPSLELLQPVTVDYNNNMELVPFSSSSNFSNMNLEDFLEKSDDISTEELERLEKTLFNL